MAVRQYLHVVTHTVFDVGDHGHGSDDGVVELSKMEERVEKY